MTDETENDRAERILGGEMKALERLLGAVNPEVIFAAPKNTARVIDLRKAYDIATDRVPLHQSERFRCYDRITFDPLNPIYGYGPTPNEAMVDLLQNLADEAVR
jgi:hypothetical protein